MNIKLNHKIIQDMCGTVSFKRGDSFCRANKVTFTQYHSDYCEAIVNGTENFLVQININGDGSFQASCSCPKLASFQKDCQHIAAVLLKLYEHQRNGTLPTISGVAEEQADTTNTLLPSGLLNLFTEKAPRSSSHQHFFENRKMVDVEFTIRPITTDSGASMLGIAIKLANEQVSNARIFLNKLREGQQFIHEDEVSFDPQQQCFSKENSTVVSELIKVVADESVYGHEPHQNLAILTIPPSAWERVQPALAKAPAVMLLYQGETFSGVFYEFFDLGLQFDFSEREHGDFGLSIMGLDDVLLFPDYDTAILREKMIKLNRDDSRRLTYFKQLLSQSSTPYIPIPAAQQGAFLEKVIPSLKSLGNVTISGRMLNRIEKAALVAKLYLDRVKGRLLAGLEFQYDNECINPLEESTFSTVMIRDLKKEETILGLMDEGEFTKTEGGYYLHNEELEYQFLYHILPKLQKHVQVFATTAIRNRIFKGNSKPLIKVKVKKERMNWLEFKFELSGIPEQQVRDVLKALEEKRKYYRLRDGALLSLETREFEEIQRFLKALPVQNEDLEAGLNVPILTGIRFLDQFEGESVFSKEESFREFLEKLYHPERLEFVVPNSLSSILRNYQVHGFKWMKALAGYGFGGILADSMGLGKTVQAITFILSELDVIRTTKQPALIVCPSSLSYNWLSEFMKFAPEIQAVVNDGAQDDRLKIHKELSSIDVLITSYTLLRKDIHWFEKQSFHTVFFDEAQAFKNPLTQTAKSVKKLRANHRFALTGTPVENSIEELWSIYHVVFPELFQGLKDYSHLTRKAIARRIRPFLLRRLKEDVLSELPEKIESLETTELLQEQKQLYAAYLAKLRHDTLKHLDKDTLRKNRIKILAGLTRLRQICCHPALFVDGYQGSSAKFELLFEILQEAKASQRRVLIFSQFTKMLDLIGRRLTQAGDSFFYLDGSTPPSERVEICNRFNAGERDLFLISLKAGGTGLNLTGADTVILYDIWWNPAVEAQAADRAHRMGQEKVVQVIKLVARGTIEEKMNELQNKKKDMISEIIDPADKRLTTLTDEDIREILMI
ncbi:DEAD/DEAH box helicase [Bacillus sp. DNRA2]|uniref:DEAD/DEAH box helicase n=1 Tax=Bacillus sp. DNRA2 TaxID=2723053 RepID=UPI00145DA8B1|nr:DEAD/DEAH box helicase [Bacillus sp. DNRA2]NMD69215.1 DEAD/DEAH box helicase [Bacillus sp. DNRA2]